MINITAIAYLRDGDEIVLGADRCASHGNREYNLDKPKFINKPIRVQTEDKEDVGIICVVIALTGYLNILTHIEYSFTAPPICEDEEFGVYLGSSFLPKLKKSLKKAGLIEIDKEKSQTYTPFYLFYKGVVYSIDGSIGFVLNSTQEYDAIGSGAPYCLGSLATTSKSMKPEKRIKKSIESAAEHISGVNDIIDIVRIKESDYECK